MELDHLVVAAASLEQGVAWCEDRFGVTPGPGGRHGAMGTHNRLLRLRGPRADSWPRAYLEILAIDPLAPAPTRPRWFGLDDATLRAALENGPRLVHWVVRADDPDTCRRQWAAVGLDPGPLTRAERATPHGVLRWRLSIPDDGRPQLGGALPALIAWELDGAVSHPADRLDPATALTLQTLRVVGLPDLDGPGEGWPEGVECAAARHGKSTPSGHVAPATLEVTLAGPAGTWRLSTVRPAERLGAS